jgi:Fe-S-cluster containining protein
VKGEKRSREGMEAGREKRKRDRRGERKDERDRRGEEKKNHTKPGYTINSVDTPLASSFLACSILSSKNKSCKIYMSALQG